ncbi:unnamed protein product [Ceutorhynchus assimilis]|uniref:DNA polymerase eta n=1 Tax=Ceutorhynchus assimilis TaxID=467358 RepID=A0A9N9MNF9_9CUCU|nr:unnamed protein product [Ceutorhynchus assimilis]
MSYTNRIVLLIDMDCFYCQVEENLDPNLKGKPLAVVQYNQWRGGGIIAVNYPARERGVTRHMRGNDAKEKCPEIILAKVPQVRGKADLSKYRDAGKRVAAVLQSFTPLLERASVDEAYLDITDLVEKRIQDQNDQINVDSLPNTYIVGSSIEDFVENVTQNKAFDETNLKLALGGVICEEIRAEVFKITGYRCSAGIAHNKILAKLVCGLHKPNKQTILPQEAVPELYQNLRIKKITGLGGKFGNNVVEKLNIEFMGELSKFTQRELAKHFDEKSASFLYQIARGIDSEPVNTRLIAKSIGCSKNFPGKTALCTKEDIEHWLDEMADEIFERLEKDFEENNRKAKQMVVSFAQDEISSSKTHPLNSYEKHKIFENAFKIIQKNCMKDNGSYKVTFLGISAGNFQDHKKVNEITSFFKNMENRVKKNTSETLDKKNSSKESIYSNTTLESDIDDNNLIFYEQMHPDSISDQNFEVESSSDDSISGDIGGVLPDLQSPKVPAAQSFFSKYFSGNSNRNFNTSKALGNNNDDNNFEDDQQIMDLSNEEIENSDLNKGIKCPQCGKILKNTEYQSHLEYHFAIGVNKDKAHQGNINIEDYHDKEMVLTNEETNCGMKCPQCSKIVKDFEYQSHLDYHFAISIVKDEAHLYKNKPEPKKTTSPPTNTKTVTKKRKKEASGNHKPIGEYFKNCTKNKNQESLTDICNECNKQIPVSEQKIHFDYHAARKLHLEINVAQRKIPEKGQKSKQQRTVATQKNLMGFLKTS